MGKHTPGPWHHHGPAGSQHSIGGYVNASDNRQQPAICHVMGSEFSSAETRANAALIAAAPDMLAALLAAVECGMVPTSSATEGGAMKYVKQAHVADQIRAAIKKAEGGKA